MDPAGGDADGAPIVALGSGHLADLEALVADSGWNQTADDWRLMLASGAGFGVVDAGSGAVVASAVALPYGDGRDRFAWIAMVLVRSDRRRRGLASLLMRRAVAWCEARGLVPWLDATPAGATVYAQLGFRPAGWRFARWRAAVARPGAARPGAARPGTAPASGMRAPAAADLDAASAWRGAPDPARRTLLADLARRAGPSARACDGGLVLGREGRTDFHVGPILADDAAAAIRLLDAALAPRAGAPVIVDAVAGVGLEAALAARGFSELRPFTRMALGADPETESPARLFAVAGPEYG